MTFLKTLPVFKRYIERQKEHHKKQLFEDELRELLAKYRAAYDERYIWR